MGLFFPQICKLFSEGSWTVVRMSDSLVPYAYGMRNGHWEWIAYDDVESMTHKVGRYLV